MNLKFINTDRLKFFYSSKGVTAIYDKKEFTLGHLEIFQQDFSLSKDQYFELGKAILHKECAIRGFPIHKLDSRELLNPIHDLQNFTPFYKYVSDDIFKQYIQKGKWQLGCLKQYRSIENSAQRDEFEGYSLIGLNINNHLTLTCCNTGFNYLIFCGTKEPSERLSKQFGPKELYFPNVRSFADSISKSINAKRYYVGEVKYNSLKIFVNENPIINPNISNEHILVNDFFDELYLNSILPSLFCKPESFCHENEVRIVFEMSRDHIKPLLFENKNLLKLIKH